MSAAFEASNRSLLGVPRTQKAGLIRRQSGWDVTRGVPSAVLKTLVSCS